MLTQQVTPVQAVGDRFRAPIPQGEYVISSGNQRRTMTLLPGGRHSIDLRGTGVDFTVSHSSANGAVTLSVNASGPGRHTFHVRGANLVLPDPQWTFELNGKQAFTWQAKIVAQDVPWIAVIHPDNDLWQRREAHQ